MQIIYTSFIFIFLLFFPKFALAYIDPSIFSIIIQGIVGAVISILVFVKFYFYRIKDFLKKIFKKKKF